MPPIIFHLPRARCDPTIVTRALCLGKLSISHENKRANDVQLGDIILGSALAETRRDQIKSLLAFTVFVFDSRFIGARSRKLSLFFPNRWICPSLARSRNDERHDKKDPRAILLYDVSETFYSGCRKIALCSPIADAGVGDRFVRLRTNEKKLSVTR